MMARPDIEAIKARTEQATEGPWLPDHAAGNREWPECFVIRCPSDPKVFSVTTVDPKMYYSMDRARKDAWFIAHARADIPTLLAYIATLETAFLASVTETLSQDSPTVIHDDIMDVLDELHALGVAGMDGEGTRRALMEGTQ